MLKYCEKCGHVDILEKTECMYCFNELKYVPEKYIRSPELDFMFGDGMEEKLMQEIVFTSPNFEQKLYDEREKRIAQHVYDWETIKNFQQSQNANIPKCPTCQSTNIRKIGGVERGASVFAFGLFSKKINKTFKCNSCGYTW